MIVQNLEGLYPTNCMHFKMKICLPSANTRKWPPLLKILAMK